MPPLLRIACPEDKAAILALMVRVVTVSIAPAHRAETIENVTQNLEVWCRAPEQCVHVVAERDSEVVGVILVKAFWNLCSLFVAPEWQRSGIGRQLVLSAIRACRGKSPRQAIYLNAAASAVSFYKELGFISSESRQQLPPGFQAMQLALAPSDV
jgi:GNAT superfamily N-acetyltransferase